MIQKTAPYGVFLARAFGKASRHAEAQGYYERALATFEKVSGPDDPNVAYLLENLDINADALGQHAAAQDYNH